VEGNLSHLTDPLNTALQIQGLNDDTRCMTPVIANIVTDGEVFEVATTTFTSGLDMLKRCGAQNDMFAANPARHNPMQLTRHGFVNFVSRQCKFAHISEIGKQFRVVLVPFQHRNKTAEKRAIRLALLD
jgi:hypothetical protein